MNWFFFFFSRWSSASFFEQFLVGCFFVNSIAISFFPFLKLNDIVYFSFLEKFFCLALYRSFGLHYALLVGKTKKNFDGH